MKTKIKRKVCGFSLHGYECHSAHHGRRRPHRDMVKNVAFIVSRGQIYSIGPVWWGRGPVASSE